MRNLFPMGKFRGNTAVEKTPASINNDTNENNYKPPKSPQV